MEHDGRCESCEMSKNNKNSGRYFMGCIQCCTRLVLSAYPDKRQAAAMLAAIERFPGAPGRAQVLESVARSLGKRP